MIVPRRFFALVSFAGALALAGTVADAQDAPATPSPTPSPVATASAPPIRAARSSPSSTVRASGRAFVRFEPVTPTSRTATRTP